MYWKSKSYSTSKTQTILVYLWKAYDIATFLLLKFCVMEMGAKMKVKIAPSNGVILIARRVAMKLCIFLRLLRQFFTGCVNKTSSSDYLQKDGSYWWLHSAFQMHLQSFGLSHWVRSYSTMKWNAIYLINYL